MGRFAWSQVRFRPARALALVLGALLRRLPTASLLAEE
jgi:hypothetical protein